MRNVELRNKWIKASNRQNKDKSEWKPSESDRVCSIHFAGSAYEANSVPTLNLGYEVEEKKARRTLIRQPLPKKSKIKENNDVGDEDDVVPLPRSTAVTESQPTVICSTPYNCSATPLAGPPKQGGRGGQRGCLPPPPRPPPRFADIVPFFSKSLLNVLFLKIFNR